jgi:hypothetical protein
MRLKEFVTESAKLWSAKVRVNQPNYVGYVDAQVWAPNAQIARTMFKQQYQIQDHHVGSVKEIKMKAKEFVKEAYGDSTSLLNRIRQQQGTPTADNPEGRAELRRREQERQNRDEQARRNHQDLMAQLNDIYVLEKEIAAVREMKRQGISAEELDRTLNQAFARYKQRWNAHHPQDPQATPQEQQQAADLQQQAEVYMGQAQRVDQPGQLPAPANEELSRVAKLAGVPVKEEWNANMTEIYEAANTAARAIYCIGILTNRAFQQKEDPQGELSERLADVEEYQEDAEMALDDLRNLGATLTYNRNSPRMFTLNVPKMKPYVFDIRDIVDSAVNE